MSKKKSKPQIEKFPQTVLVVRESEAVGFIDDEDVLLVAEDVRSITNGCPVAVYKLVEVKRKHETHERKTMSYGRRYAEKTKVPANQTRSEIEQLLTKHGASGFMFGTTGGKSLVLFEMRERRLRFIVPMPELNKSRSNEREVASETRRRWRALLLVLKAKLEAVVSEIVMFDEEFLAHIMVDGKTTVGDHMIPQMKDALAGGKLPNLLTAGDG